MLWHEPHSEWVTGRRTVLANSCQLGFQIAHFTDPQGDFKGGTDNIRLATQRVDGVGTQRVYNDAFGTTIQLQIREGARTRL